MLPCGDPRVPGATECAWAKHECPGRLFRAPPRPSSRPRPIDEPFDPGRSRALCRSPGAGRRTSQSGGPFALADTTTDRVRSELNRERLQSPLVRLECAPGSSVRPASSSRSHGAMVFSTQRTLRPPSERWYGSMVWATGARLHVDRGKMDRLRVRHREPPPPVTRECRSPVSPQMPAAGGVVDRARW